MLPPCRWPWHDDGCCCVPGSSVSHAALLPETHAAVGCPVLLLLHSERCVCWEGTCRVTLILQARRHAGVQANVREAAQHGRHVPCHTDCALHQARTTPAAHGRAGSVKPHTHWRVGLPQDAPGCVLHHTLVPAAAYLRGSTIARTCSLYCKAISTSVLAAGVAAPGPVGLDGPSSLLQLASATLSPRHIRLLPVLARLRGEVVGVPAGVVLPPMLSRRQNVPPPPLLLLRPMLSRRQILLPAVRWYAVLSVLVLRCATGCPLQPRSMNSAQPPLPRCSAASRNLAGSSACPVRDGRTCSNTSRCRRRPRPQLPLTRLTWPLMSPPGALSRAHCSTGRHDAGKKVG